MLTTDDPLAMFHAWYEQAVNTELNDANAIYLATSGQSGMPNIRVVLMKGFDENGLVFYTNLESAKGRELLNSERAAVCFDWRLLRRQIIVQGKTSLVSDTEADAYFQSRARQSRLGAWASKQSHPLKSKMHLLKQVAKTALKYPTGPIPRPPHWSGFRLVPQTMAFLQRGDDGTSESLLFESTSGVSGLTQVSATSGVPN